MGVQVGSAAVLMCSFGGAPGSLSVLPTNRVQTSGGPVATIQDFQPMVNIASFGICSSPSNPQVAAATAAALGVLTPQPCVPATMTPWTPGSPTVLIGNIPALTSECTCNCMWGGVITISAPGQVTVETA